MGNIQNAVNSTIGAIHQGAAIGKFLGNQDKEFAEKSAALDNEGTAASMEQDHANKQADLIQEQIDVQKAYNAKVEAGERNDLGAAKFNATYNPQMRDEKGRFVSREKSLEKYQIALSELEKQQAAARYQRANQLLGLRKELAGYEHQAAMAGLRADTAAARMSALNPKAEKRANDKALKGGK